MAGKGSKDNRTPDYEKRAEAWDRIFGKNGKELDKQNSVKSKNDINRSLKKHSRT